METEASSVNSLAPKSLSSKGRDRTGTTVQDAKYSFLKGAQVYLPNFAVMILFWVSLPKLELHFQQSLSLIIF